MARYDHYENGEWVGTTEVPGTSNADGWVHTYSADGKSRSTWVSNPAQYDYSYNSQPKSWEDRKAENEALHSVINFILTFSLKIGVPLMIIEGIVVLLYFITTMGLQQFLTGVKELLSELLLSEDVLGFLTIVGCITLFCVLCIIISKIKGAFKKVKGNKGNTASVNGAEINNQTNETTQDKKLINLVELAEMQRKRSDEEWL